MQKLLFLVLFGLVGLSFQADTKFCDLNTLPVVQPELPFPLTDIFVRYEARLEENSGIATEDTEEFFDGVNNVGATIKTFNKGLVVRQYVHVRSDQLLMEKDGQCFTQPLKENIDETPFFLDVVNGTDRLASGITWVANPNIMYKYVGNSNTVRNIPVHEWQTCYYGTTDVTLKVKVSFADQSWLPSEPQQGKTWTPLQVVVESKIDGKDEVKTRIMSITKFRYVDYIPEERFNPSNGVFCLNRNFERELPTVPESFSFISQIVTAIPGSDGRSGVIVPNREHYDYLHKLFLQLFIKDNRQFAQLHDFSTGLNYTFDFKTFECTVDKISHVDLDVNVINGQIQMKNMSTFFDFESLGYQYAGKRHADGVNAESFIALKNGQTHEWRFRTSDYDLIGGLGHVPVVYIRTDQKTKAQLIQHFFNFKEERMATWEYDVGYCVRDHPKQHFSFELLGDRSDIFYLSHDRLETTSEIARFIREHAKVTILRVSRIETLFERGSIIVTFTLYDRVKEYGNVPAPENDVPLNTAVSNLKSIFSGDKAATVSFRSVNGTRVKLTAHKNSLRETKRDENGILNIERVVNVEENTPGAVAAVTVIATLVGISIGILLMILHKLNKINLPFLKLFVKD